jgi:hypothetical protein
VTLEETILELSICKSDRSQKHLKTKQNKTALLGMVVLGITEFQHSGG